MNLATLITAVAAIGLKASMPKRRLANLAEGLKHNLASNGTAFVAQVQSLGAEGLVREFGDDAQDILDVAKGLNAINEHLFNVPLVHGPLPSLSSVPLIPTEPSASAETVVSGESTAGTVDETPTDTPAEAEQETGVESAAPVAIAANKTGKKPARQSGRN